MLAKDKDLSLAAGNYQSGRRGVAQLIQEQHHAGHAHLPKCPTVSVFVTAQLSCCRSGLDGENTSCHDVKCKVRFTDTQLHLYDMLIQQKRGCFGGRGDGNEDRCSFIQSSPTRCRVHSEA